MKINPKCSESSKTEVYVSFTSQAKRTRAIKGQELAQIHKIIMASVPFSPISLQSLTVAFICLAEASSPVQRKRENTERMARLKKSNPGNPKVSDIT